MAINEVSISSDALIKIGANPISSFEEGTAEAIAVSNIYHNVKRNMLASHPWNFATTKQELPRLDKLPTSDYAYAYQLPNDLIRIISAGSGQKSFGMEYKVIGSELECDYEEVIIKYIRNVEEPNFPEYFKNALTFNLASELTIPLTESTNRAGYFKGLSEQALRKAKLIDAQEETNSAIEDYTLINARY
jgi:hypothetical protein